MKAETSGEPIFTPAKDVIEPLNDGSGIVVVARAGVPMGWARARMLGLVDGEDWPRVDGVMSTEDAPAVDPDALDTLHGVDVPPGDLATDLAAPGAILDEEIRDAPGAVIARAKHASTPRSRRKS